MSGEIYRARMRLLHRFDLCWMQPRPLCEGDDPKWIKVRCDWCGVSGRRLDMDRATLPDWISTLPHSSPASEGPGETVPGAGEHVDHPGAPSPAPGGSTSGGAA